MEENRIFRLKFHNEEGFKIEFMQVQYFYSKTGDFLKRLECSGKIN